MPRPRVIRSVCAATMSLAVLIGFVPSAGAHVEITPAEAERGTTLEITISPENEEADAGTVKIAVQFPRSRPIATAIPTPKPDWTATVTTRKVRKPIARPDGTRTRTAVDVITWEGGPSPTDGAFDLLVTIGALPTKGKRLVFKVVQTYENGHIDRWLQVPSLTEPEPEAPAPVLILTKSGQASG